MAHLFDFSRVPGKTETLLSQTYIDLKESELASLQAQTREAQNLIAHARYYIAPIRKLVPDTLCMVFELCIADDPFAPWKLAGVTASWRKLMLSSPRMWSRIVLPAKRFRRQIFNRRGEREQDKSHVGEFAELWLSRTLSDCPLDIEVNTNEGLSPWFRMRRSEYVGNVKAVVELFVPHIHRWRHFTFFAAGDEHFEDMHLKRAPFLQTIELHTFDVPDHARTFGVGQLCMIDAPRLQSMILRHVDWVMSRTPHPIPRNLRHFSYINTTIADGTINVEHIVVLLRASPALSSLEIQARDNGELIDNTHEAEAVQLPCLTELKFSPTRLMNSVLGYIRTPCLNEVTLSNYGNAAGPALCQLISQYPSPPIKNLTFHCAISIADLGHDLAKMRFLERLAIGCTMDGAIITGFPALYEPQRTSGDHTTWAMPSLRKLAIDLNGMAHTFEMQLESRLTRRRAASALPNGPLSLEVEINVIGPDWDENRN